MSDIIITPNKGSANAPTIQFSGSANASASIRLEVLPEGQVAFLGKSGSLFSISDNMVGSLMAVSDISGLPILEVFSDDRIIMGKYNKNTLYVSGTNVGVRKVPLNAVLDVSGSVAVTGSLGVAGSILADGGVTASLLGTASYALNALTASYSYSGTSGSSGSSGISGGTANYVARFTGATTLSTGVLYDNATNVGISKTTPNAKLDVNGNTIITGSLAVTSDITAIGNVTAYFSDDRLKNNLGNIPDSLNKVLSLNGFYFEPNQTAIDFGYTKQKEVGVSAQQVQAILPEIIAAAPIDPMYMTVRYEKLIPLLIEAIKEQNSMIVNLQQKINRL